MRSLFVIALAAAAGLLFSLGATRPAWAVPDNCPGTFNPDQADTDYDGIGDACDPDTVVIRSSDFSGSGDANISNWVDGDVLSITTSTMFGGAVMSLIWRGVEFIDTFDHGRELQYAAHYDFRGNRGECFNPTEAGAACAS